ncbi:MAG TPA: FixH family protein [Gemmatimonadaceae bacterium]|nr:FixH family protein [Gemmatimonadaceae bacterium]
MKRFALSIAAAAALSITGCMLFMKEAPRDLDYSRTQLSSRGVYRGTIQPVKDSIRVGRLHSWRLRLETAEGTPVDSATIVVDGGMPQHGHGLPTKPRVTKHVGNGEHIVDGMKFNMGGWWVVKFRVASALGDDSVTFNLKL